MSRGLVIGKFYPPHMGHHYLIEQAQQECDELMVMVLWSFVETIPPQDRVEWLKEMHPDALVVRVQDENPIDYSDEGWQKHINVIGDTLMEWGHKPDVVFSSEEYGDELASRLADHIGHTVYHKLVDKDRTQVPISATDIRKDAPKHWDMLSPPAKAGLAFRVCVCGGESTGTTTLAKALAEHYETAVAPEYGRHFDWAVGKKHEWTSDDFNHIAHTQVGWIERFSRYTKNGLVICDTDAFATAMFHEVYLGSLDYGILDYAVQTVSDMYLITDHTGVNFVDDGTRFNSGKRPWMTKWFEEFIDCRAAGGLSSTRMLVSGNEQARLKQAIQAIDSQIGKYHIYADPIGEVVVT